MTRHNSPSSRSVSHPPRHRKPDHDSHICVLRLLAGASCARFFDPTYCVLQIREGPSDPPEQITVFEDGLLTQPSLSQLAQYPGLFSKVPPSTDYDAHCTPPAKRPISLESSARPAPPDVPKFNRPSKRPGPVRNVAHVWTISKTPRAVSNFWLSGRPTLSTKGGD